MVNMVNFMICVFYQIHIKGSSKRTLKAKYILTNQRGMDLIANTIEVTHMNTYELFGHLMTIFGKPETRTAFVQLIKRQ